MNTTFTRLFTQCKQSTAQHFPLMGRMQNRYLAIMEYKIIPTECYDDVIEHLRDTFFADEPLNKAAGLRIPNDDLEALTYKTLRDNMSVMAVSKDNEFAGVCLNGGVYPGDMEEAKNNLELSQDEKFKKIFRLLYKQSLEKDFFTKFNADKIYEIRILSVSSKFRGHGIAKELVNKSMEIAKDNGFKVAKTDATGMFSQKIFKSNGFQVMSELFYEKYVDVDGKTILPVESPHIKLQTLYKEVN